jgi:hypothetical protein
MSTDSRGGPRLFDVYPAHQLYAAMRGALPSDAEFVWRQVGSLTVSGKTLVVMDAESYLPRYFQSEGRFLSWTAGSVEVWLQLIQRRDGHPMRVARVLLSLPGSALPSRLAQGMKQEACSMAIDSASMLVADVPRLQRCWKIGGSNCRAFLGHTQTQPERRQAKEQAAALLTSAGFALEREERGASLSFRLSGELSDDEIGRAEAILAAASLGEWINVTRTQSLAELHAELDRTFVATFFDENLQPYLFAFPTGFGDGLYYWDAIVDQDRVLGYFCDFMPPEDAGGENEMQQPIAPLELVDVEAAEDAIEIILEDAPSASLEPLPIEPGAIVSVNWGASGFHIARAMRVGPQDIEVQSINGSVAVVPAGSVVAHPGQPVFRVGDKVLALWLGSWMYPGTITAVSHEGYTVAWHDGDKPLVVRLGTLTYLDWCRSATAAPSGNPSSEWLDVTRQILGNPPSQ